MQHRSILVKIILFSTIFSLFLAACATPAAVVTPTRAIDTPQASTPEPQVPTSTATSLPPTDVPQTPTATATEEAPMPIENLGLTFTYIGSDGNLWLADASGGPPRQITTDASPIEAGGDVVSYYFPRISTDGRYIAVRRDAGVPVSEGIKYMFGLLIHDIQTGESSTLLEDPDTPPAGFDWKPGSHMLAYGLGTKPDYFLTRGEPNPDLATGIYLADLDSGETNLLVSPKNGRTLILPTWSPDGKFLSFDEVVNMEGRGPFAYYDLDAEEYISWDEPVGFYDWSPDSSTIAYDRMLYTATGDERIFTRPRLDGTEKQVSPDTLQGYAFYPVYSPDGSQLAYLLNSGGIDNTQYTLVVQNLSTNEARQLGTYELAWYLDWSPDGRALIFSAGPYDALQVYGYDLVNDTAMVLAEGGSPSLAGK